MSNEQQHYFAEAARQMEICNACRYCEGYCAVFPALMRERMFTEDNITQLANLCHNCRGCYYACQYIEPHEFDLNIPKALADVRQESWKDHAWPKGFAHLFDRAGLWIVLGIVVGFAAIFAIAQALKPQSGEGFYAYMSHGVMVSIFLPAFVFPLFAMGVSVKHYWQTVGGGRITWSTLHDAFSSAARMKNLQGGHGAGCNFEDEDRFSLSRWWLHQLTMYGFLLCFASTSSGTILHYVFAMEAPYDMFSLPKLLGISGGIALCIGTSGLAWLKYRAAKELSAARTWNGDMAFILLLFTVSASGLILYAATDTLLVPYLLAFHLGCVLAFFVLTPYSKMVHGLYRMAALIKDATEK